MPLLGWNSLEDDGRHRNLKEFLLEGNEGQQTRVEQAKEQEDTLGTEDGGNVRVLQEPGKRFSVILVDFDSAAIKITHQCMSTVTAKMKLPYMNKSNCCSGRKWGVCPAQIN